jgi:hypothetical protein
MTAKKKTSAKKTSAKKTSAKKTSAKKTSAKKTSAKHPAVLAHRFLAEMLDDDYFPTHLVERGQGILLDLCAAIEREQPVGAAVYALTHAATEHFNALDEALQAEGSEIETAAREQIAADVDFILHTYGYGDLDLEEAIAPRDW